MAGADFVELDRRAVRASVEIVSGMTTGDLARATPCADWNLGELLAHMTAQHDGFAAAAAGRGADLEVWQVRPLGDDPAADYAAAAERVIAAFAEPGVLERRFALPEIVPSFRFPAAQAISFHFIDYVVHGWDVARSLGAGYQPDDDLLDAALSVARAVPDGQERRQPGAAFRPGLNVPPDAAALDQVLSLLGRSPAWRQ
ncbi:MAG TPA: TIGR03086 family metal-binding protein [Streptosporangiaceae bacterium]|nr:TIGR03086 family metal-binding protein [Streptosporangiaceae bacterium]